MTHWARPGVECICVNSVWTRGADMPLWMYLRAKWLGLPVAGGRYILVDVGISATSNAPVVRLKGFGPLWFRLENFRPLVPPPSQEQDIALFSPLLDPARPLVPDEVSA